MVRLQEQGSLVSPWSLMSCLLLQAPSAALTEEGLPWRRLAEETLWLRKLALDLGARLNWPGKQSSNMKKVTYRSCGEQKESFCHFIGLTGLFCNSEHHLYGLKEKQMAAL